MEEGSTYYSDSANPNIQYRAKLGDNWGIVRTLGHGATATVMLGVNLSTGDKVAVKILKDNVGAEILAEIAALSLVKDLSNIIKVLEFTSAPYSRPSKSNPGSLESK